MAGKVQLKNNSRIVIIGGAGRLELCHSTPRPLASRSSAATWTKTRGGPPEFIWPPYYPAGSVQGKMTTAALASQLKMWTRMGHPRGRDFLAADFFARHPEYAWQSAFLKDMKSYPWTLFEAKKQP